MTFRDKEQKRGEALVKSGFFDGDTGNGKFKGKRYPFVLQDGRFNLYPGIRDEVLEYFKQNNIAWWGGKHPTGHILSSQIACLNHLFAIRNEKDAVLKLLKSVSDDFVDVFPIPENLEGYIQFEAVGGKENFLNERKNTRGSNCTSVDALICARHRDGRRFLIPIEWKYVEKYGNKDKSTGSKGDERKARYLDLIKSSRYLNEHTPSYCWFEPFYQLMRQTLWAEQLLKHRPTGFEADNYLHLHVVPEDNAELLDKSYPCSNKGMIDTWESCLNYPEKYTVVHPNQLWSKQSKDTAIYEYLSKRYW
ncbi:MAG: PGN_0703 family putative restriction endonuclease [Kiritimatiellia bacterium]|jgi:hypothetical protein